MAVADKSYALNQLGKHTFVGTVLGNIVLC